MARTSISPGRLYSLLNGELRVAQRTNGCTSCRMPLPFLIERPDDVSANWRIGTPHPCTLGCDVAQGYLVSRPVPGEEVVAAVAAWHGPPA